MIFEIEISDQADADLRGIYEYIAFELQSPENAAGQLDRLKKGIMSLDQMPERFREYENEPWRSRGLHIIPVDNYCVLYITDNEFLECIRRYLFILLLFPPPADWVECPGSICL